MNDSRRFEIEIGESVDGAVSSAADVAADLSRADHVVRMSKAERLAVAGQVAPTMRRSSGVARTRRVHRVDPKADPTLPWVDAVVGFTTVEEVQKSVLAKHEIEFDLHPLDRPTTLPCLSCKNYIDVPAKGPLPTQCNECKYPLCLGDCGRIMQAAKIGEQRVDRYCRVCNLKRPGHFMAAACIHCGKRLSRGSAGVARRTGKPARCGSCAAKKRNR